ncbi:hypothetical protein CR513_56289, partial [Mucuna pruriens]
MSFQSPIHYSFRQRHLVCSLVNGRVLLLTRNKVVFYFSQAPIDTQASRISQQSGTQRLKEVIRRSKRMIGIRTSTNTLVVPHHATLNHSRTLIHINIRHRHYNSTVFFQPTQNKEEMRANLDLLQEKLKKGDLFLKRTLKDGATNKLTPNWEGPYRITKELGKGAFRLEHLDG